MAKIDRSAFLYLDGTTTDFAQCGSCIFGPGRCAIMGDTKVDPKNGSCGFYINGPSQFKKPIATLTKEQTGYVEAQVRCENCDHFDKICLLYQLLNNFKGMFDLDEKVKPRGCCNAWSDKG